MCQAGDARESAFGGVGEGECMSQLEEEVNTQLHVMGQPCDFFEMEMLFVGMAMELVHSCVRGKDYYLS